MNSLSAYVEMLLRGHDCVVLPGLGALLCNYVPAHFDADNDTVIHPPSRCLAFNGMLSASDGMLASSIARAEGITYEAAVRCLDEEVELMRRQLDAFGEFQFGNLGMFFVSAEGQIGCAPSRVPSLNGPFYGLQPIEVLPLDNAATDMHDSAAEIADAVEERVVRRNGGAWRAYATGVAASLAVIVTTVLFLVSPIRIDRTTRMASIAPVPVEIHHEIPVADVKEFAADVETVGRLASLCMVKAQQPVEADSVAVTSDASMALNGDMPKPSAVAARFNDSDRYCVIVASFPTKEQADLYVGSHSGRSFGILEKDGRYRVYSATASTYAGATAQMDLVGQPDAWICRR